ncbi:MAG TPA: hypothetical protein VGO86_16005 [Candidatus Dormibacteraeota bacterium]
MSPRIPGQAIVVAGPLLLCSLLLGIGSSLAFRPAALTPSIVAVSPAPAASRSPSPTGTPSPPPAEAASSSPAETPSPSPAETPSPSPAKRPAPSPRASRAGRQLPP